MVHSKEKRKGGREEERKERRKGRPLKNLVPVLLHKDFETTILKVFKELKEKVDKENEKMGKFIKDKRKIYKR